jgi:hypothetical protein
MLYLCFAYASLCVTYALLCALLHRSYSGLCDEHAALIRAAVPEDVTLLLEQVER